MKVLDFDLNCTLPVALLESYSLAIDIYQDKEVLINASYLIDISLLSHVYLKFTSSLVVICALSMSLQKLIGQQSKDQENSQQGIPPVDDLQAKDANERDPLTKEDE